MVELIAKGADLEGLWKVKVGNALLETSEVITEGLVVVLAEALEVCVRARGAVAVAIPFVELMEALGGSLEHKAGVG